ncbi:hypothetical protein [Haloarcula pellucida]|uniref:Uncharacterized protein n=1 Tax=Haloarcula pellucida TaxID=1427151 RepID=A0A830GV03_9EURY|nr:hypothetical protein [Halomicroarcula pellucida]MBX0350533.1 hypothetical protein [Halomicroarcula pellucida]GGO03762.1 hypothetical protein GCM10009030_39780 [Halomicroarcula pellucida]
MKRDTGDGSQNAMAGTCYSTSDRFLVGSMSIHTTTGLQDSGTTVETTARTLGDSIASATLGADGEGYEHHYIRSADAVVVIDGDDVDHVEYLDGRRLETWRDFVDQERGWTSTGQLAGAVLEADQRRKEATDD